MILGGLYNTTEDFSPTVENLAAVANRHRVILTNRAYILSQSIDNVFPLPFNVFANQIEMITERGFPLLDRFSTLISHMRDSGIIQKLYNDFYYNVTMLHNIRDRDSDEFKEAQIVLTLGHMNGAFTMLIMGLLISSVTFGVELLVDKYYSRRRVRRLWKLLRNSCRQVFTIRTMQNIRQKNAKMLRRKWHEGKKFYKKIKLSIFNKAFKNTHSN